LAPPEECTSSEGIPLSPEPPHDALYRGALLPLRKPWESRHMGPEAAIWATAQGELPIDPSSYLADLALKTFSSKAINLTPEHNH